MVRSGIAVTCGALLCLAAGCPKDVEDPGFTASDAMSSNGSTSEQGSTSEDEPEDEDDDDSNSGGGSSTSTTGTPGTSTTTGTPATSTTTTDPATGSSGDESDSASGACGDGAVDQGEQCDGADLQGLDCNALGLGSGNVSCTAMCTFDTSMCMSDSSSTSG